MNLVHFILFLSPHPVGVEVVDNEYDRADTPGQRISPEDNIDDRYKFNCDRNICDSK